MGICIVVFKRERWVCILNRYSEQHMESIWVRVQAYVIGTFWACPVHTADFAHCLVWTGLMRSPLAGARILHDESF